ncbi:glycoside hydrolase family 73 protein [Paenibacillus methanolicus]|uniref:Flagellum-specific peptidoglycan hydrolase FlgJ n=1 Tax=Paenibacillus methanolicus TaxID=582686 RepID=A0A5S5CEC8_9BACL|nr:glycoside hydrolase family 73 protein [Paenibacillus methanolicus]TYP77707.1 flagellum-specific peptidoglycan hydrolase FlgJ [Paenibacillus methanolicus]
MALTREQFIDALAPMAQADERQSGVPASITIAQAILESNSGNSQLAVEGNNLFGMKGTGPAGSVVLPTKEQRTDGSVYTVNAVFRAYSSWQESVRDHSELIARGVSWNRALYSGARHTDGRSAAKALQEAGYATDIRYADKLIAIIDRHELDRYDLVKGDEPMTAEEKAAFEALEASIKQLSGLVTALTNEQGAANATVASLSGRVLALEAERAIAAPAWFVQEFGSDDLGGVIQLKSGSLEFWRTLAVVLRLGRAGVL